MTIPNLPSEFMHLVLAELEQALFTHDQWCEDLFSTLICRLPPDQREIEPDAHKKCRFGQWYYGAGTEKLRRHRGFEEIATEHQRMHDCATALLTATANQEPIHLPEYERFINSLKRLRLEIATLRHDVEDSLYNLDPLTGAANRIGMLSKLRAELELVKRKVHSCCVVMMDLDNFKQVNDAYGHAVGDHVLVRFAQYAMSHLRPYDKLFRYGGEEFLLFAVDADLTATQEIVERLREGLASISQERNGNESFHVTVSAGLALLDPEISVEESLDRADKALYAAKSRGRNGVIVWDPSMT